jgi:hypothetical protein
VVIGHKLVLAVGKANYRVGANKAFSDYESFRGDGCFHGNKY